MANKDVTNLQFMTFAWVSMFVCILELFCWLDYNWFVFNHELEMSDSSHIYNVKRRISNLMLSRVPSLSTTSIQHVT